MPISLCFEGSDICVMNCLSTDFLLTCLLEVINGHLLSLLLLLLSLLSSDVRASLVWLANYCWCMPAFQDIS